MRRIHRTVRRVALMAAAAVLAGSLSAQTAQADTIINTGFEATETPAYTAGSLTNPGQNGWVQSSTDYSNNAIGSPSSTAVVTTSAPTENAQAVTITHAVGENIGVAPHTVITQGAAFTVTVQVDVNYATIANGPFFGLNLYGNNGAVEIGALGIDATSGNIYDHVNNSTLSPNSFLLSDGSGGAPAPAVAGDWTTLKIVANFSAGAGNPVDLTYFVGGVQVDTETTSVSLNSFDYGYMFSTEGFGAGSDTAGAANFDNFSITTSITSVPEPTGLALAGIAGAFFAFRRSRRSAVVAM